MGNEAGAVDWGDVEQSTASEGRGVGEGDGQAVV